MTLFSGYEPARACTAGPEPGSRALMGWFLGAYTDDGGRNLGIFNCRTVRGGSTTSLHGEGRACDFGINPHGATWGDQLAEQLRLRSGELGIQCIIWERRIWSGSYPTSGWRPYSGTNAHVDHIHVELSRHAARTLTAERVQQVMGGQLSAPPPAIPAHPAAQITWIEEKAMALPVLYEGDGRKGTPRGVTHWYVLTLQAALSVRGLTTKVALTGEFDKATTKAVKELQTRQRLTPDGAVGPATWPWVLGNPAPDYAA